MLISVNFSGFQRTITGTDKIHLTLKEGTRVLEVVALVKSLYSVLDSAAAAVFALALRNAVPIVQVD